MILFSKASPERLHIGARVRKWISTGARLKPATHQPVVEENR